MNLLFRAFFDVLRAAGAAIASSLESAHVRGLNRHDCCNFCKRFSHRGTIARLQAALIVYAECELPKEHSRTPVHRESEPEEKAELRTGGHPSPLR